MKGIFHPDNWNDWDTPFPNVQEIRKLDPAEDKNYLEYLIQHAYGSRQKTLMKKLGLSELPERRVNPEIPEDDQYEEYYVLREQVAREPDAEVLKEAAYEAPTQMARFAFCRLTKYSYTAQMRLERRDDDGGCHRLLPGDDRRGGAVCRGGQGVPCRSPKGPQRFRRKSNGIS